MSGNHCHRIFLNKTCTTFNNLMKNYMHLFILNIHLQKFFKRNYPFHSITEE